MMHVNEKRRAVRNAIERLEREGAEVIGWNIKLGIPTITIEMPPVSLMTKSHTVTERKAGARVTSHVAKLSGCLVRWYDSELPEAFFITQHLNPYAPELIASWPNHL